MKRKFVPFLSAVAIAAAVFLMPTPGHSQGKGKGKAPEQAKAASYVPPRAHDGKADLQGIWQVLSTGTAANVEPHTPALGIAAGVGVIVDPADGKIPYKPEARAKQQANFKDRAKLDPMSKCYMPGVPRVMYIPFPLQILQTEHSVTILSEYMHTTRNIFLGGKQIEDLEMWMGDSRGKWEGDTLVVNVRALNGETWFDQSGNHHSEQMKVTERFTRTGPDTLQYEATFDDPKTYTRPWTMRLLLYRHTEPNFRLLEYDCNAYMEFEGGAK
jgi:hypothetical protein